MHQMSATYNYWLLAYLSGVAMATSYTLTHLRVGVGNLVMGNTVAAIRSMGRAAIHGYDSALCFIKAPPARGEICPCGDGEALRETERTYRGMFDQALVAMFRIGPDGRLLEGNPVMASVLGYASPEELLAMMNQPLWTIAVSRKRQRELRVKVKATGQVQSLELEVFRKDGSTVWISANVRAEYVHGAPVGFMGSFENITERRLVREQSLQSQKLESVGQLAAGIAHEINTPVQYIGDNIRFLADSFAELMSLNVGYARLLAAVQRTEVTPQMVEEMAQMVAKADVAYLLAEIPRALEQTSEGVSRVSELVGAMREFSHPGTGEKVPLNLNRAIENTITVARNEWEYVADMRMELDSALPLVSSSSR